MTDNLLAVTRLPWHWEWVPPPSDGAHYLAAWTDRTAAIFSDWTGEGLAAVRRAWNAEMDMEFPFTSDLVSREGVGWLLDRAAALPEYSRLAWGAAFMGDKAWWAPVPVVVEFRAPRADDPTYLMDLVGANGAPGDARDPVIDYVTTDAGDGVRVFALARSSDGAAYGRADAALRIEVPPYGHTPGTRADVLISTMVFEIKQMAVIGWGVEQLMHRVAADSTPQQDGGPPVLPLTALAEGAES